MLTNCPICRALLQGADTCRRCRTEVGEVRNLERRGRALAGRAMQRLAAGDHADALRLLRRSLVLHATPEVQWLAATLQAATAPAPPGTPVAGNAADGRLWER